MAQAKPRQKKPTVTAMRTKKIGKKKLPKVSRKCRHWQLTRVDHRIIGPTTATGILTKNIYQGQRIKDDRHVLRLVDMMKRGLWTDGDIVLASYRGTIYLINGQHTCHAIQLHNDEVPVTLKFYEVNTLRDLALLYAQYDTSYGIKMRRLRDAIRALTALEPATFIDLNGDPVPVEFLELFCTGLVAGVNSWGNARLSFDQKIDTALLNTANFQRCLEIYGALFKGVKNEVRRNFRRSPVFKVIFETWKIDPVKAAQFWLEAQAGAVMDNPKTMGQQMGKFLSHTISGGGHIPTPPAGYLVLGNRDMHNYCVLHWNAMRAGSSDIELDKVADKNQKVV